MNGATDLTGAQSVDRALKLLSLVGQSSERGSTLNELVEASGYNKATTRRLLLALIRANLVNQEDVDRRYYLGREAYILGTLAAPRFGILSFAMNSLIRLSKKTGDACFLSVRRLNHSICLHREEGNYPVRSHVLQKGMEHPLGVGAGSLAMLATLDDAEIETVLSENAGELARNHPAVSVAKIKASLDETRRRSYAVNPGMFYPDAWAIAVALSHPDGRLLGALSIAAIESRLQPDRQRELAVLLKEEAGIIIGKLDENASLAHRGSTMRKTTTAIARKKS